MDICANVKFLAPLRIVLIGINIIKIVVPLILIVVCMIQFVKAVVGGEEALSDAFKLVKNKFILAVSVFLVPTLMFTVLDLISNVTESESCIKNATSGNITSMATSQIDELLASENKTADTLYQIQMLLPFVYDNAIKDTLKEQITALKKEIYEGADAPSEDDGNSGSGGSSGGSTDPKDLFQADNTKGPFEGKNIEVISNFISGNEGGNNIKDKCTVSIGPKKGESGYKVTDIEGRGIRTTAHGITNSVIGNFVDSCFDDKDYAFYFKSSNFTNGSCVPEKAFPGALKCLYSTELDYPRKFFAKHCKGYLDFDTHFNTNQKHAFIDFAHSGISFSEKAIKAYCEEYKVSKNREVAADAYFKKVFALKNGNYAIINGSWARDTTCNLIARRECEVNVYFGRGYFCAPYATTRKFIYRKYHDTANYNCKDR
ncbi:MAG: hypothetical protein RR255_05350 [Bacilli bacterium]